MEEKLKLELKALEGEESAMTSWVKMVQYGYRATRREERRLARQIRALLSVLTGLRLCQDLPDFISEGALWLPGGKQT